MKKINRNFIKFLSILSALIITTSIFTSCKYYIRTSKVNSCESLVSETTLNTNSSSPLSYLNEPLNGPYEVERVIDGDTIIATIDGVSTRIRLIGIDAPESVNPNEELNTPEGATASQKMSEILSSSNNTIYLEYDEELYDQYDRLLAYVYICDVDGIYIYEYSYIMVEEILLREGFASTMTIEPNSKYEEFFEELMRDTND